MENNNLKIIHFPEFRIFLKFSTNNFYAVYKLLENETMKEDYPGEKKNGPSL